MKDAWEGSWKRSRVGLSSPKSIFPRMIVAQGVHAVPEHDGPSDGHQALRVCWHAAMLE